jgi:hypothetical protein
MKIVKMMIPCCLLVSACTIEQQNGDLRATPAPLFGGQDWQTTQQYQSNAGSRVCTVSSGEIDVTLRREGSRQIAQVAPNFKMDPGTQYKIRARAHGYETRDMWFDGATSRKIIADMRQVDTIYTEKYEAKGPSFTRGFLRTDNKISMAGFANQLDGCERFLKRGK